MSDTDAGAESPAGGERPQGTAQGPNLSIRAQYIKDLSFENPAAPQILMSGSERPKIDISIGVRSNRMSDTEYEVELQVNAKAEVAEKVAFVAELKYGGLFVLSNFPQEQIQPVVMIECPRLLFPFARQILAGATRDGGFPPLMIDPIDFVALYRRQQQEAARRGQEQAPTDSVAGSA